METRNQGGWDQECDICGGSLQKNRLCTPLQGRVWRNLGGPHILWHSFWYLPEKIQWWYEKGDLPGCQWWQWLDQGIEEILHNLYAVILSVSEVMKVIIFIYLRPYSLQVKNTWKVQCKIMYSWITLHCKISVWRTWSLWKNWMQIML